MGTRVRNSTKGCTGAGHARLRWRNCFFFFFFFFPRQPETPREREGRKRGWYTRWLNLAWLFPWANTREVQCYVTRMYRCEKSTYLTRYAIRYLDVSSDARAVYRSTYARLASASPDTYTGDPATRLTRFMQLILLVQRQTALGLLIFFHFARINVIFYGNYRFIAV